MEAKKEKHGSKENKGNLSTEELLKYPIEANYVQLEKKKRYYYDFPASNLDLMNDFLIEDLVKKLSRVLELLKVIELPTIKIFSYQQGISYEKNIAFREEKIAYSDSDFHKTELRKQVDELTVLQQKNSEKSFVLYFDINNNDESLLDQFLTLLKRYIPGGYLLAHDEIVFMLKSYYLRDMSKTTTDKNYVPNKIDFFMSYYRMEDYYRKVFAITKYPDSGDDGVFANLVQLENVHINIHYETSNDDISELVNMQGMKTDTLKQSAKHADQLDGTREENATRDFYQEARGQNSSLIRTSIFIEVVGKTMDELKKNVQRVEGELGTIGFKKDLCLIRQKQGFHSVQPLGNLQLKTKHRPLTSLIAASLYPMSYQSKNDSKGINIGKINQGSTMFVDFAKRNKQVKNGNVFVDGASGSGKTKFIQNFIVQHAQLGYRTYTFDSDKSEYKGITEKIGGEEMNASTGSLIINPFEPRYAGFDEEEGEKAQSIMSFHKSWLLEFFLTSKKYMTSEEDDLGILIDAFYNRLGFITDDDALNKKPPIAENFYEFVEGFNDPLLTFEEKRTIQKRIHSICKGADKILFNGQTSFSKNRNVSINTQALLLGNEGRAQAQLYNIMTYLFMQSVLDSYPTILAFDEWYLFLKKEYPMMAIQIRNWFKRCRKYNAIGLTGSQNLNDAMQEGLAQYTEAVISNCANHVLFQPGAKEIDYVQDVFSISDKEFNKIVNADRGAYLFLHGNNRYFVESEATDENNPYIFRSVSELIL